MKFNSSVTVALQAVVVTTVSVSFMKVLRVDIVGDIGVVVSTGGMVRVVPVFILVVYVQRSLLLHAAALAQLVLLVPPTCICWRHF